jgi:hypothetical protein
VKVTVRVVEFPTLSVALNVSVFVPSVSVLINVPLAAGPAHEAMPEPPSAQA